MSIQKSSTRSARVAIAFFEGKEDDDALAVAVAAVEGEGEEERECFPRASMTAVQTARSCFLMLEWDGECGAWCVHGGGRLRERGEGSDTYAWYDTGANIGHSRSPD